MRSLFQLVLVSVGILAGLAQLSIGATQTNVTVRVMAANLTGNSQKYEAPQIRIIQGLRPDVTAIQEFNYSSSSETDIRSFVDTAFGTNFSYFRETNGGYDIPNGVISRWPILNSGSWDDPKVNNRGFAWARIDLPGTNDLYVVSCHLYSSGSATDRNVEANSIKTNIQTFFPSNAWVIVAGDFNTDNRSEAAVDTFKTFLSDFPIPTDAFSGDPDTNLPRNHPYDYVLPSFSLTNSLTNVVFASHSFPNGLVFVSTNYAPLPDVSPVQYGDSTNGQHMAVLKDFRITYWTTNGGATPPSITNQPQSLTVTQGNNAAFAVGASGDAPLSYQWRFNTTNISSATNSSYTRSNAQPAHAGSYTVVVTNSAGSVTSAVATLTVLVPPSVTNQPQSLTVTQGNNAAFTVGADGTAPLSYQWRFGSTNINGATASSYTRSNAQPSNAGSYTVVVTNSAGSVTSAVATLTVLVPPSITNQPQSLTVTQASDATFTVAASGTAPLSYQWRFNATNISAATNNSYTRSNAQPADAGSYTVLVTNSAGSMTSAVATLIVLVPPFITDHPQNLTVTQGNNATFTVGADGTAPLSYQWRFDSTNILGATASSYTRTNVQVAHAGSYSVVVTNSAGSVTSSNAILTVPAPPTITGQPLSQIATQGWSATFNVTVASSLPLRYQWRFNASDIDGATDSSYTRTNVQPADMGSYSVVVTNSAGSATSSNAVLSLYLPPPLLFIESPAIIRWQGLSNFDYTVEAKTNLNATNWAVLGTASSPTTNISFTNQDNGSPRQFYRVVYP